MLTRTSPLLNFRARVEFDRLRGMLRGRAKLERKIGVKQLTFLLRTQTKYRVELESYKRKTVVRKQVDAAAQEHGTAWSHIRNDLARHDVLLLPTAQATLAKYEPLAFRALMELSASEIAPPPPPGVVEVPKEAYFVAPATNSEAGGSSECASPPATSPAAAAELRRKVESVMASPSTVVKEQGPATVDDWLNAWRTFEKVDPQKRLQYRRD